jgi:cell division protein ZapA (FtsZ GTPase activity inhibitor)
MNRAVKLIPMKKIGRKKRKDHRITTTNQYPSWTFSKRMNEEQIEIQALGTSFFIKVDEDPLYMKKLVSYYKKKTEEIQGSVRIQDPLKIAILSGVLITDELFKKTNASSNASSDQPGEGEEASKIADRIIKILEETLPGS